MEGTYDDENHTNYTKTHSTHKCHHTHLVGNSNLSLLLDRVKHTLTFTCRLWRRSLFLSRLLLGLAVGLLSCGNRLNQQHIIVLVRHWFHFGQLSATLLRCLLSLAVTSLRNLFRLQRRNTRLYDAACWDQVFRRTAAFLVRWRHTAVGGHPT